jgi:hypothetical protein
VAAEQFTPSSHALPAQVAMQQPPPQVTPRLHELSPLQSRLQVAALQSMPSPPPKRPEPRQLSFEVHATAQLVDELHSTPLGQAACPGPQVMAQTSAKQATEFPPPSHESSPEQVMVQSSTGLADPPHCTPPAHDALPRHSTVHDGLVHTTR